MFYENIKDTLFIKKWRLEDLLGLVKTKKFRENLATRENYYDVLVLIR